VVRYLLACLPAPEERRAAVLGQLDEYKVERYLSNLDDIVDSADHVLLQLLPRSSQDARSAVLLSEQ
jgi:hypothetical protein